MRWKMAVLVVALASAAVMPGTTGCQVASGESLVAHVTWQAEVRAEYGSEYEPIADVTVRFEYYRETGGVRVPSTYVSVHGNTGANGKASVTQNERIGTRDVLCVRCTITPPGGGALMEKTEVVTHAGAALAAQNQSDAYLTVPVRFVVNAG